MTKSFELHVIGVFFAIAYGFLTLGLLSHFFSLFIWPLPYPLFLAIVFVGLLQTALFSEFVGQAAFNFKAAGIGLIAGFVVSLFTAQIALVPYTALIGLVVAAIVSSLATEVFPATKMFKGESRDIMILHTVVTVIIIIVFPYALWFRWAQPFMAVIGVAGYLLWFTSVFKGCPLTYYEGQVRKHDGEKEDVWKQGFLATYGHKWLGLPLEDSFYERNLRVLAIVYFSYYIISYLVWYR